MDTQLYSLALSILQKAKVIMGLRLQIHAPVSNVDIVTNLQENLNTGESLAWDKWVIHVNLKLKPLFDEINLKKVILKLGLNVTASDVAIITSCTPIEYVYFLQKHISQYESKCNEYDRAFLGYDECRDILQFIVEDKGLESPNILMLMLFSIKNTLLFEGYVEVSELLSKHTSFINGLFRYDQNVYNFNIV